MISLIDPSEYAMLADTQSVAQQIAKLHAEFTDRKIYEALFAKFGYIPTHEDIVAHCQCFVDHENVSHYVWYDGAKPNVPIGEKVDLSQAFLSIAPPEIFNPEN